MTSASTCPKCASKLPEKVDECPSCGVILSKLRARPDYPSARTSNRAASSDRRIGDTARILGLGWLALGVYASLGDLVPGAWLASMAPAWIIYVAADSLGLTIDGYGPFIGYAHSPPFLLPLGLVVVYGAPSLALLLLAWRLRRASER